MYIMYIVHICVLHKRFCTAGGKCIKMYILCMTTHVENLNSYLENSEFVYNFTVYTNCIVQYILSLNNTVCVVRIITPVF